MARNRSLTEISDKILKNSHIIEGSLSELWQRKRPLKVLEIGFGFGRALLELASRFQSETISFYGVDKRQKPPVESREDLRNVLRLYKIVSEQEISSFRLPHRDKSGKVIGGTRSVYDVPAEKYHALKNNGIISSDRDEN